YLYTMGFWNLMSIYLSHNALTKVRDLGTFYHLLPENPNAAHWLTWQLRQLSISGQLQGIYGGMQAITKGLLYNKMGYIQSNISSEPETCVVKGVEIRMYRRAQVSEIKKKRGEKGFRLKLADGSHANPDKVYGRVILALPKAPAYQLVADSPDL